MPEDYAGEVAGTGGVTALGSAVLVCGCARAVVRQGGHETGCPQGLIVGSEDPGALTPAGGVLRLSALSTDKADWTRVDVVPEAAILRLNVLGHPGLWQRHGSQLVRVSEDEFAARVEWCEGRGCGVCTYCEDEKVAREQAVLGVAVVEAAVRTAMQAAARALAAYEQWDGGCAGQDFELASTDAADCLVDLQNGARSLRNACRIVQQHSLAVPKGVNGEG